jgi:hypothetical protein
LGSRAGREHTNDEKRLATRIFEVMIFIMTAADAQEIQRETWNNIVEEITLAANIRGPHLHFA